jgi:hypothetical protein
MTEKLSFEEFAVIVRDSTHNLDLDRLENKTELYKATKACIKEQEGFEPGIYDDGVGNLTIGYGFNMDEPGAEAEWVRLFGTKYDFKTYKESTKLPKKDRPLIEEKDAAFAPQNKKSCEIYYLQIFRNYFKCSLSGAERICYDHVTYSIEGNL